MAERAARTSLLVALLVLGLKALAYRFTGSVALLSDALESTVNVAAALMALLAIRFAHRPPDATHPFGHTKAEYLSAVLEGVFILLAAFFIAKEALPRLLQPTPLKDLGPGLLVSLLASTLNGLLAYRLISLGKALRSPALTADGYHVLSDVLTSLGVLVGVGLAWATGLWVLDPLLALLVAANILYMGFRLVRESLGGLLDEGLSLSEVARIQAVIARELEGKALEVHDLKTRKAGHRAFLEFHLVVPGSLSVAEAHALCDRLERALEAEFPGLGITIHVEPESERPA